jgi:hypothetical protein
MLALVSTGLRPGLVTVALKSWQSNCDLTVPSHGGGVRQNGVRLFGVRPCADAILAFLQFYVLPSEQLNSEVSYLKLALLRSTAGRVLSCKEEHGPNSFLVSR